MDIYVFSLALGGLGLGTLALGGLGHHGHAHHGHAHHGHAHHGHHAPGHHGAHGQAPHAVTGHASPGGAALNATLWTLGAPRIVFSVLLGLGATGMIARALVGGAVGGVLLFALAVVGGLAFERLVVRPLLALLFGFASAPALTLDSTLLDEALAASGFDANGEGLVALEVDGQVVQVLGTLRPEDRALGIRVRAGDRLRVEDVDGARHRCTVAFLARP